MIEISKARVDALPEGQPRSLFDALRNADVFSKVRSATND